ncbi:MAG: fatty acid hydroxylase [SAR324 cluster bacterium]|uniref:Fatty acid hydroxylase n=1 Tax=SAR324 cluster bacterium TaxID=2024889 RepID=A0A2A4T5G3_9DELT|nr:MAG: fatty acid hydroxylase [SAR324 cluster bacterium]
MIDSAFIIHNEVFLRVTFFISIFLLMALWEIFFPRRDLMTSKLVRWYANFSIVFLNNLLIRFLFPTAAIGIAIFCRQQGWGILNNWSLPSWLAIILAVILLDFTIYLQHVMFHFLPLLWRLHRMHHTDLDFDVSTAARFHPIEIIISMLIKISAITLLGAPAVAVFIFEVLLNGSAMFNHSNIRLPRKVDRVLRCCLVTPDMHRVHHSVIFKERNCNFGFNLPWWDWIFGTYRDQPRDGHQKMKIGTGTFLDVRELHLHRLLMQPFLRQRKPQANDED